MWSVFISESLQENQGGLFFFPLWRELQYNATGSFTRGLKEREVVTQQASSDVAWYQFPFHTGEILPHLHLGASIVSDEISPSWHHYRVPSPAPCMCPPLPLQILWDNFAHSGLFHPLQMTFGPLHTAGLATGLPGYHSLVSSAHHHEQANICICFWKIQAGFNIPKKQGQREQSAVTTHAMQAGSAQWQSDTLE